MAWRPLASIVNYGQLEVASGNSVYVIAENIENHAAITAPGGNIVLAAGQTVLVSERPDGRGISMEVTLPGGSVDNTGKLIADGGTISARARVVNQDGLVQADSVRSQNGVIEFVASGQLNLGANSQIVARGDDSSPGRPRGNITLANGTFWNLADATGVGGGQLTLEAGGDVILGDGAAIYDAGNWSVTLKAGVNDFNAGTVQSGTGNIFLNGSSAIGLNAGSIDLTAGQNIQIGGGSVTTMGGGNISATALAGSVNTGSDVGGYVYKFGFSRSDILYAV